MKILHIVGSFVNGGVETLLVNTVNHQILSADRVGVMVLTNNWSRHLVDALNSKVDVFFIDKPRGSKNPWYLLKIMLAYHRYDADILHLHCPGLERLFFPKNKGERRIVTIHNDSIPIPFSKSVNRYVAISQCVYDSFRQKTGKNNCTVCRNGIDSSRFNVKKDYPKQPRRILMVGRVVFDIKGQDTVVKAIAGLPKRILDNIHLDIWGDGPDIEELRRLVSSLGMEEVISVPGDRDNEYIAGHLRDYDLFVQASLHEGLGLSVIEAMISGVPLLVSDAQGLLEVTDNGKFGMGFRHSDVESFKNAFIGCFERYEEPVRKAVESRRYVSSLFSMDAYIDALNGVYLDS